MKTPNLNVQNILKKLSFLKNNLALLVPILIAVVALLLFVATPILGGRLRKTVEAQSVQTAKTIQRLAGQIEEAARAKQMEPYMTAYARDANQIENMMKQATMRELLTYRIFPDTNERTQLLFEEFKHNYLTGIDAMLESIRGGAAPTWADIQAAWKEAPKTMYGDGYGYGDGMYGGQGPMMMPNMMPDAGMYGRGQGVPLQGMTETQRKIMDTVCLEKARAAGVYAGPLDVAGYTYWMDWTFVDHNEATRDCWYWQVGHWVIEDVMTTIREMNKGTTSVLDARVKRLMNVNFVLGRMASRSIRRGSAFGRGGAGSSAKENPTYVTSARDAMTAPCTGRVCSEDIDVVHFNVRVVVEARDTMTFMKQLCAAKPHQFKGWKGDEPVQTYAHNQISILESGIKPVDAQTYDHILHRYGDAPVVELDLICEYVFDKPTYEGMKPKVVQQDIIDATTKKTGPLRR